MTSLEEMASKGQAKLTGKASQMKASWEGAKSRMKSHYGAQPFGTTRKANFNAGLDRAVYRFDSAAITKWRENWIAKMAE